MTRSVVRRAAALFVLCVLLAAPWSDAGPRHVRGAAPPSLLDQVWSQLSGLWSEIGCIMDPNGACMQIDIGCGIDPGGRCHDSVATDIGCGADPNGRCHDSVASDIGCGADPHGGCGQ